MKILDTDIDINLESCDEHSLQGVQACISRNVTELSKELKSQISFQVKQQQDEQQKSKELTPNASSDAR